MVVLKVLVKKGPLASKGAPNQTGNLHHAHFRRQVFCTTTMCFMKLLHCTGNQFCQRATQIAKSIQAA